MEKTLTTAIALLLLNGSIVMADTPSAVITTTTTAVPPATTQPVAAVVSPAVTTTSPAGTTTTITIKTAPTTMSDSDQKIVNGIYKEYAKSSALIGTQLNVVSENGMVTIDGQVTQQAQLDEAMSLAKKVVGVKDVKSNVIVTTVPQNTVTPQPSHY